MTRFTTKRNGVFDGKELWDVYDTEEEKRVPGSTGLFEKAAARADELNLRYSNDDQLIEIVAKIIDPEAFGLAPPDRSAELGGYLTDRDEARDKARRVITGLNASNRSAASESMLDKARAVVQRWTSAYANDRGVTSLTLRSDVVLRTLERFIAEALLGERSSVREELEG